MIIDVTALLKIDDPSTGYNIEPNAPVEVRDAYGNLAIIYSDENLATPISQPANCDANGQFLCYADDGLYNVTISYSSGSVTRPVSAKAQDIRYRTLSQAISENAPTGTRYTITDLDNARYDVVLASDSGGLYKSGLASGRKLKLAFDSEIKTSWYVENDNNAQLQDLLSTGYPVEATSLMLWNQDLTVTGKFYSKDRNKFGLQRSANGVNIDLSATESKLWGLKIDGKGSLYTGHLVEIGGGTDQDIDNCDIVDGGDNCIVYTAPGAGLRSKIRNSKIYCYLRAEKYAVKYPDNESNGDRHLYNIDCAGGLLADFNGCSTILVGGCNAIGNRFTGLSKKVAMSGNRWAGGTANIPVQLRGDDHSMVGDIVATDIIIEADCQYTLVSVVNAGSIIENSNNRKSNKIYGLTLENGIPWYAINQLPSIGNGTITSTLTREGKVINLTIDVLIGSTTTFGAGEWYFEPPYNTLKTVVGDVIYNRGGTGYLTDAKAIMLAGTNLLKVYTNTSGTAWNSGNPFAWAAGDSFTITIQYQVG